MEEKILRLKKLREERIVIEQEEKELTDPVLIDKDIIPLIYEWIEDLSDRDSPEVTKYGLRKYFIVIICALYSPRMLVGGTFERNRRKAIADYLCLSEPHISNSFKTVYTWYSLYKDFRNHTNYLYSAILSRLREYGMIDEKN